MENDQLEEGTPQEPTQDTPPVVPDDDMDFDLAMFQDVLEDEEPEPSDDPEPVQEESFVPAQPNVASDAQVIDATVGTLNSSFEDVLKANLKQSGYDAEDDVKFAGVIAQSVKDFIENELAPLRQLAVAPSVKTIADAYPVSPEYQSQWEQFLSNASPQELKAFNEASESSKTEAIASAKQQLIAYLAANNQFDVEKWASTQSAAPSAPKSPPKGSLDGGRAVVDTPKHSKITREALEYAVRLANQYQPRQPMETDEQFKARVSEMAKTYMENKK
jgi:hypothetical protein